MLKIDNISVSIGPVGVLRNVSMQIDTGIMAGLLGRNGAGKTTIMKTIMGIYTPKEGKITFNENDLSHLSAYKRVSLGIGYAPEDRRLIPDLKVVENLYLPMWALGNKKAEAKLEEVYAIIPELKTFTDRGALARELSGGQQKLVAIGRALMSGEKLLLLDEPFEGVAPALSKRIAEVISKLRGKGLTVILSGADLQHAEKWLDKTFQIDRGQVQN